MSKNEYVNDRENSQHGLEPSQERLDWKHWSHACLEVVACEVDIELFFQALLVLGSGFSLAWYLLTRLKNKLPNCKDSVAFSGWVCLEGPACSVLRFFMVDKKQTVTFWTITAHHIETHQTSRTYKCRGFDTQKDYAGPMMPFRAAGTSDGRYRFIGIYWNVQASKMISIHTLTITTTYAVEDICIFDNFFANRTYFVRNGTRMWNNGTASNICSQSNFDTIISRTPMGSSCRIAAATAVQSEARR